MNLPELIQRVSADITRYRAQMGQAKKILEGFNSVVAGAPKGIDAMEKKLGETYTRLAKAINQSMKVGDEPKRRLRELQAEAEKVSKVFRDPKMMGRLYEFTKELTGGKIIKNKGDMRAAVDLFLEEQKRMFSKPAAGPTRKAKVSEMLASGLTPIEFVEKEKAILDRIAAAREKGRIGLENYNRKQKEVYETESKRESAEKLFALKARTRKTFTDEEKDANKAAIAQRVNKLATIKKENRELEREEQRSERDEAHRLLNQSKVVKLRHQQEIRQLAEHAIAKKKKAKEVSDEIAKQEGGIFKPPLRDAVRGAGFLLAGAGKGIVGAASSFFGQFFNTNSMVGLVTTLLGVNAALAIMRKLWDAITDAIKNVIERGMEFERLRTIFSSLTGSAEKGSKVFNDMLKLSGRTPFSIEALSETSEELLAMGTTAEDLLPTLEALGDIALGDSGKLKRLAVVFAELAEGGKLSQFRLRELAKMGITAKDFARTLGVSTQELQSMVRLGMVDGNDLIKVINKMRESGERFGGSSARIMETTHGQWQRLKNAIDAMAGKMGEGFLKKMGVSKGLEEMSKWIDGITNRMIRFAENVGTILGEVAKQFGNLFSAMGSAGNKTFMPAMNRAGEQMFGPDTLKKSAQAVSNVFLWLVEKITMAGAYLTYAIGKITGFLINIWYHLSMIDFEKSFGIKGMNVSSKTRRNVLDAVTPFLAMTEAAPDIARDFIKQTRKDLADQIKPTFGVGTFIPPAKAGVQRKALFEGMGVGTVSGIATGRMGMGGIPLKPETTISPAAQAIRDKMLQDKSSGRTILEKFQAEMKALNEAAFGSADQQKEAVRRAKARGLDPRFNMDFAVGGIGQKAWREQQREILTKAASELNAMSG